MLKNGTIILGVLKINIAGNIFVFFSKLGAFSTLGRQPGPMEHIEGDCGKC